MKIINELINIIGIMTGVVGIIVGIIGSIITLIAIYISFLGMQQPQPEPVCTVVNIVAGEGATVNINSALVHR